MYRFHLGELQVLLVHPGGPLWARKDAAAWFVPKGEINPDEEEFAAAKREFTEETGIEPAGGQSSFIELGQITQRSGKKVTAWAFEGDCDPSCIKSNTFEMEWPPRSGKKASFPEVDRASFFNFDTAKEKMIPAEFEFFTKLQNILNGSPALKRSHSKTSAHSES
jgi:predicted NUDIX family NTP pyrophosphohydrolase